MAKINQEGFQMYGETTLEFFTKLKAQLYPIIPKIENQYRLKVELNDYLMNLHKN